MTEQWQELKETIIELRDNDGTGTQQEVCKFLANLMDVLEKQMSDSENLNKGDLISRQAVLDELEKWDWQDLYLPIHFKQILDDVPSVENKDEWIPVSERLPEERQSVLVWCPQYKNIYCACLEKEQWWIFGAFVQIVPNEVVAWMPLPEPYKADMRGE